jgi:hypothetical protein
LPDWQARLRRAVRINEPRSGSFFILRSSCFDTSLSTASLSLSYSRSPPAHRSLRVQLRSPRGSDGSDVGLFCRLSNPALCLRMPRGYSWFASVGGDDEQIQPGRRPAFETSFTSRLVLHLFFRTGGDDVDASSGPRLTEPLLLPSR